MDWEFLKRHINSEALLLDCRSENAFQERTIRGAFGAALIKKPFGSGPRSMTQLGGLIAAIVKLAADRNGILCFDEGQGMYASRMAWILRAAGVKGVEIFATRFSEITPDLLGEGKGQIEVSGDGEPLNDLPGLVSIGFLQKNLTRVQLLDVRTPGEYEGLQPRLTSAGAGDICGRIPGSLNWDWRLLYNSAGEIKERTQVHMDIRQIGLIQERPTVIYDYNGARSCTTALVLAHCGYRQVSVYLGSWMEWRKSNLPKQNLRTWKP